MVDQTVALILAEKLGLNTKNSIIIGSGILQALGIRKSNDIDLVITRDEYQRLKKSGEFTVHKTVYKREVLKSNLFEIGTNWRILGKSYEFNDFKNDSVIIDKARYVTLDFLYKVKKSWVQENTSRPKDITDIRLIEEYKENHG